MHIHQNLSFVEEEGCVSSLNTTADVRELEGQLAFLLKGGCAVFVLATGTMTMLATWGLASPNPANPVSMQ